jgi:predicted nucleic acid-binding protein
MILVDSSAWIEFLRATGGPIHLYLKSALREEVEFATTDVVMMEILTGAKDDRDRDGLRRFLYGLHFLPVSGPADYESAAELQRLCRRGGETPHKILDCLIAVVAMRHEAEVLCCDADFHVIARHAPLRLAAASLPGPV